MARFNDEEIGGMETGSVRFRLTDNRPDILNKYNLVGRKLLGDHKLRMSLGLTEDNHATFQLQDGTLIKVISNMIGLSDIDEIWIQPPPLPVEESIEEDRCIGFIAHLVTTEESLGFTELKIKGEGDTVGQYLGVSVGGGYQFEDPELVEASTAIPETYDNIEPDIADYSWQIYYGTIVSSMQYDVVDGTIPPGAEYDGYPDLEAAANYITLSSWTYETRNVSGVDQLDPRIYTGGYIENDPPGGARFKADPIPGTFPVCAGYADAVCSMSVTDAEEAIAGANYVAVRDVKIGEATSYFQASYDADKAAWLATFDLTFDEQTVIAAPEFTLRNTHNHIMISSAPTLHGYRTINFNNSETSVTGVVVPGRVTYKFDDTYWFDEAYLDDLTQNTKTILMPAMTAGIIADNLNFNCVETSSEFYMSTVELTVVVPNGDDPVVTLNRHFIDTPSYHQFTADAEVAHGDYIVYGTGGSLVHLTLVCEKSIRKKDFRFNFDEDFNTEKVLNIKIGQPFKEVDEIVTTKDASTIAW